MEEKFKRIREIVEKELSCSAHSIDHIIRVQNLCLYLAKGEKINLNVLQAAALLHDIARAREDNDPSGNTDHAVLSSEMSMPILKELGFSEKEIMHIHECIISHRYRTGNEPRTMEAKILFDADKLDALGAIGIARGFVWAGKNNSKLYTNISVEQYIKENLGGKINGRIQDKTKHSPRLEFETKLKFIPGKLYTQKAKEVAGKRMRVMEEFFDKLEKEIKGEA